MRRLFQTAAIATLTAASCFTTDYAAAWDDKAVEAFSKGKSQVLNGFDLNPQMRHLVTVVDDGPIVHDLRSAPVQTLKCDRKSLDAFLKGKTNQYAGFDSRGTTTDIPAARPLQKQNGQNEYFHQLEFSPFERDFGVPVFLQLPASKGKTGTTEDQKDTRILPQIQTDGKGYTPGKYNPAAKHQKDK